MRKTWTDTDAQRLKALREQAGADQAAFAKATADVTDKWMAGNIGPYVKKVVAAARAK